MGSARGIFISYRRSTSAGYAGRIRDHLTKRYGGDNVFMDVDSIAPGTDFVDAIDASLGNSRAVLVVIDPQWATVADANGTPRLRQPTDWVRTEIERSLIRAAEHGVALVPVLVGGAEFPAPDQLPPTIEALTRYNGVELRDTYFESDLDDVMKRLGGRWRRPALLGAAGVVLSALVLVLFWLAVRDTTSDVDTAPTFETTAATTPTTTAAATTTTTTVAKMSSDLNVAVAEFTTIGESGSVVADPDFTLDTDIFNEIEDQLEQRDDVPYTFDIRQPAATGIVEGRTADERAANAEALALQLGADVVIYGFREPTSPQAVIPEFYVSPRRLLDAVELAGAYPLGARIPDGADLDDDLPKRQALRLEFQSRTGSLTDFVVGLTRLKSDDAADALRWFQSAIDGASQWESLKGSEVFHLYAGSAHLRLAGSSDSSPPTEELDAARSSYQTALALEPGYARAMIGLAEVAFQTSRGRCVEGTTDDAGLLDAFKQYEDVVRYEDPAAPRPPESARIENKAALGRGRVMVCRSQAGSASDWDQARTELTSVIDAYENGQTDTAELAALAYGARALTALLLNVSTPDEPALRDAAADLQVGFELSQQAATRESYAGLLGFVYARLGDQEQTELWCGRTPDSCPAGATTMTTAGPDEDGTGQEPAPSTDEAPMDGENPAGTADEPTTGTESTIPEDLPDVLGNALPATK